MRAGPGAGPAGARGPDLAERIDALLPQTQCERCGFPGCAPYALALARGEAAHDRCPPGGATTVARLADLLDRGAGPPDPAWGPAPEWRAVQVDEPACIGCTLCIQICPVDAIVGAPKRMHTVIEAECTGCDLCIPVCPVDCIAPAAGIDVATPAGVRRPGEMGHLDAWLALRAPRARERFVVRAARLRRRASERGRARAPRAGMQAEIRAAVARVRARRARRDVSPSD